MTKIELVSKDILERELQQCLERRELPDHFLYLGDSGAQRWLALDRSQAFPVASDLTTLLAASLDDLAAHLPRGLNLVSLGVGSGEKERMLLGVLMRSGRPAYYGVDISSELVDTALERVADMDVEKTGVVGFLQDLPTLRRIWRRPVLLCLLGNTFCNYEPEYVFENVREQLEDDDLFLFDCHLYLDQLESIERVYRSPLNIDFNLSPLRQRGLENDACSFHLKLVQVQTVAGTGYKTKKWMEILRDTVLLFGSRNLLLRAGDVINMGCTYKHTLEQVQGYLSQQDFQIVMSHFSDSGEYGIFLLRKADR